MATSIDDTDKTRYLDRLADVYREPHCWLLPIEGHEKMRLVSLEEAIEPLLNIVPDIERKAFVAKQNAKQPADGLTPDESASIALYTMEWPPYEKCLYFSLNQSLRDKRRQNLEPYYLFLKLLLVALDKLPSLSCNVFRGVKMNLIEKYQKNSTLIWWGFSSCTNDVSVLQVERFVGKTGDRTLFSIDCYSGKDIRHHSFYQYEHEIILPPGCHFTVIGFLDQGSGSHIIQLKETVPPRVPIEPVSIARKINKYQNFTKINLTFEKLTDDDIPIIVSQIIMYNVCTEIDLSNNQITSNGVSCLALALRENTTLKVLTLLSNKVSDEGVCSLAKSLSAHNSTVTMLGLGSNDITDKGAQDLAQMLRTNRTLTVLTLQSNQIGTRGMELLMDALRRSNRSLQVLNVSSNTMIDDSCVDSVTSMLTHNQTLKEFHMIRCSLSTASIKRIQQAAKSKKSLNLHA